MYHVDARKILSSTNITRYLGNDKWDGVTISRHGGVFFSKWWLDELNQNQLRVLKI
jgi:hypothetical protein